MTTLNISHSQAQKNFMHAIHEAIKQSPKHSNQLEKKITGVQYPYKELCKKEFQIEPNHRWADLVIRDGQVIDSHGEVKLKDEYIILVECKASKRDWPKAINQLSDYKYWIQDHHGGNGRVALLLSADLVNENTVEYTKWIYHGSPQFDIIFREIGGHKYHWFVHDKETLPAFIELSRRIETEWGHNIGNK